MQKLFGMVFILKLKGCDFYLKYFIVFIGNCEILFLNETKKYEKLCLLFLNILIRLFFNVFLFLS